MKQKQFYFFQTHPSGRPKYNYSCTTGEERAPEEKLVDLCFVVDKENKLQFSKFYYQWAEKTHHLAHLWEK